MPKIDNKQNQKTVSAWRKHDAVYGMNETPLIKSKLRKGRAIEKSLQKHKK